MGVWGPSAGGGGLRLLPGGPNAPERTRRARRGSGSGNSSTWRAGRRHVGGERICWARLADTSHSGHVRPPSQGRCGQWPRQDRSPAARPPSGTVPKTLGVPDGPRSCWDVGSGEPQDRPRAGKARHVDTRRPREAKALCHGCTFPGQRQVSLGVRTTQHLGRTKDLREGSHVHTRQPTCQKSATRETPPRHGTHATWNCPRQGAALARVPARPLAAGDETSQLTGGEKRGWGGGGRGGHPGSGLATGRREKRERGGSPARAPCTAPAAPQRPRSREHRPRDRCRPRAAHIRLAAESRQGFIISPSLRSWLWEPRQQRCDCHPIPGTTTAWRSLRRLLPPARKEETRPC